MRNSKSIAISVHQRLLNIRDQTGEQFNHLLMRYGLERLLYRIGMTGHDDSFVLKGAMLFTLWHNVPGRPTRDIDLLGFGNPTQEILRSIFVDACNSKVIDDGLNFDSESIQTSDIRNDQEYHGIRVRLLGFLGKARIPIQIDIGFGDAITPAPESINYPTILDFPAPRIRAYHPATVVAEKLSAMILLGIMNSRLKDFYDVYTILKHMHIDNTILTKAIHSTFKRRNVKLPTKVPVVFTPEFLEDGTKEIQWQAFLRRSALSESKLTLPVILNYIENRLLSIITQ